MKINILILFLFACKLCAAQPATVIPSFTAPDTVCVNTPVNITNTSTNASNYFWNFCVAGINSTPTSVNLGNLGGVLSQPVFSDFVEDNGNFYAFIVNHLPGGLVRLDFGNSMLNTPVATLLGNPGGAMNATNGGNEGIQIIKNEGKWYAIIVGGNPIYGPTWPRIVKVEFGTNIANNSPTGTNWGNLGLLNEPIDLHMFQENNIWYGFTVNAESNTITRFSFTNSFNNTPTAVNLGNIGNLGYPTGIYAINDNGNWRVFITNGKPPFSLVRLDFGSSLLNIPTGTNLGNPGNAFNSPRDFTILRLCDEIAGFAVNGVSNDLAKFDFHNNLQSIPTGSSLGNTGNLNFPHSLSKFFRAGNDLYTLITNVSNNTITRLQFKGCTAASVASSALQNPLPVTYNQPGTYNINLSVDEGLPTQNSFCKQVVVIPELVHTPLQKFVSCNGNIVKAGTGIKQASYLWNTGATTDSISITTTGTYWVTVSRFGCSTIDSFTVTAENVSAKTNNDTSICIGKSVQLNVTGAAASYSWSPATDLSNPSIPNPIATPLATTQYIVTATGAGGCIAKDTVLISIASPSSCTVVNVITSFTAPDTVCVNTPVNITNTSANASTYFWNFCVAGINSTPVSVNLGNPGGTLSQPVFSDIVEDNGSFYAFVVNFLNGGLTRLNFGNSMLNTPVATNLGNPGGALNNLYGKEGIQVIKNEGKWYAIIVGGNFPGNGSIPRIVKIEFGTNIANNTPTGTNWGNLGLLDEPLDLHMFQESGIWYGFTINASTNTITRFNFTNSFNNIPTAVNLGNIGGLHYPTGIYAVNDNGFWRVFITNGQTPYSITRLDFGNSLLNVPVGNNLGNPGNVLNSPRDFTILKLCDEIAGFAVNGVANDLVKFDFHNDLQSTPAGSSLGNTGNLNFPHSLSKFFRVGNDLYTLITNVNNNTITRLQFKGCTTASISSSSLQNPLPVTYNAPGTYNINLSVDEGLPTQNSFCKQVVVLPALIHTPLQKIVACNSDSIKIGGANKQASFIWNTGATTDSIYVKTGGTYWVTSSRFGCTNTDSFMVSVDQVTIQSNNDTTVCAGQPVQLNTAGSAVSYTWTPATGLSNASIANPVAMPLTNTQYIVTGKSTNGCLIKDTVSIAVNPSPVISKTNDTAICRLSTVQLNISGGSTYTWLPAASLNNTSIPNPIASPATSSTYYFTVGNAIGCSRSDSITVQVKPNPVISKTNDSTICKNKAVQLNVSGGSSYTWLPNPGLSNTSIPNPVATPASSTTYYVTATSSGNCSSSDSIKIFVNPSPVITKTNDTAICQQKNVQLNVSGGTSYTWQPAAGLSNTSIPNPVVTALVSTTYYFTATNLFNCSTSDSIKVLVKPNPVIIKTNDTAICSNKTIQLNVSGGSSYTWLPNTGLSNTGIPNPLATPLSSSTYYVTVTNTGNCSSSDSIKITLKANPVITKSNDTAVCRQQSIQLNVSGGSNYAWQSSTALSSSSIPDPVATPLVNTTFYVIVTNAGNCSSTDSIKVLVKANPVISKTSDTSVCHDKPLQLNVSGGSSYTWMPAATLNNTSIANPVASPVTSTTYYVTVTNTGNCSSSDSIRVAVKPLPAFGISSGVSACMGSPVTLTAFGGDSYSWEPSTGLDNTGTATPVATPTVSMVYTVKIIANTCKDSVRLTTPVTVLLLPVVRATSSNDVDCAKPVTQLRASGALHYLWQPATALNDSGIAAPLSSPAASTMYIVKGTDLNGCTNYDSVSVKVTHAGDLLVNMPNAFTPNGDTKNDCFGVSRYAGLLKNVQLSVYDRWGVRVFYTTNPLNCWDGRYHGKLQDAGGFVYILKANTFCGEILKKGILMLIK